MIRFLAAILLASAALCPGNTLEAQSSIGYAPLGTAPNPRGSSYADLASLAYDAELDALLFVHEQATPSGDNGLGMDRSLDGGTTWTLNTEFAPGFAAGAFPDVVSTSFPSCAIYNPPGNTDPAQALALATGPSQSLTTTTWGYTFAHDAPLNSLAPVQELYASSQTGLLVDWLPTSLTINEATRELFSISGTQTTLSTVSGVDNYEFVNINRGQYNPSTNTIDWSLGDTVLTPQYTTALLVSNVRPMARVGWITAFSPDGAIGYAAYLAALDSSVTNTIHPQVLKSLDSGRTWTHLPSAPMDAFSALQSFLVPGSDGLILPTWQRMDAVVDLNGRLHLFCRINPRVNTDPDDGLFVQFGRGLQALTHLSVSDGMDWTARLVDTVMSNAETGFAVGLLSHNARAVLARSQDGSKLFFAWTDSDTALAAANTLPNLYVQGYDVVSGLSTPTRIPSLGTAYADQVYWPSIPHTTREVGGSLDYELPVVFADPGAISSAATDYVYMSGVGFNNADFTESICTVGLEPNNLITTPTSAFARLEWDPQPGAVACQVRAKEFPSGATTTKKVSTGFIDRLNVPTSLLTPGSAYKWQVRCACSLTPPAASAFSIEVDSFFVPMLRKEVASSEARQEPLKASLRTSMKSVELVLKGDGQAQMMHVVWMDAMGRILKQAHLRMQPSEHRSIASLDTRSLPPGSYRVLVHATDGSSWVGGFALER